MYKPQVSIVNLLFSLSTDFTTKYTALIRIATWPLTRGLLFENIVRKSFKKLSVIKIRVTEETEYLKVFEKTFDFFFIIFTTFLYFSRKFYLRLKFSNKQNYLIYLHKIFQ